MKTNILKKIKNPTISHKLFLILYPTALYLIYNSLIIEKIAKWFYLKDQIEYSGLVAFLVIGLCAFITVFTLLAHRYTTKPLAIFFVILSGIATYFTTKYNVVIDRTMIMNAVHTDRVEALGLFSTQMIPYFVFLIILPIIIILCTRITFEKPAKSFLSSLKLLAFVIPLAISLIYIKYNSIHRAANLSKKYIMHALIPINYIQSFGSIAQHAARPYFSKHTKKADISARITSKKDLVVVLAIGETSRQKNFSLYGYKRKNTNPLLSKISNLHVLNGNARIGSTLYALPEILVKNDAPLPSVTSRAGIDTSCYVNYTLYDNCKEVGEEKVKNCGHKGTCYDEDVIPLLSKNLKTYDSGSRFIVLHLGGGSHGPNYRDRYPEEFQKFKPMCLDADVVNKCDIEQLYNSYDNTIIYVDYVVSEIIKKLDESKTPYVFIYLSDHGESLLEDGHIFHGMPPGVSLPKEQADIPLLIKSSVNISVTKRKQYGQQDVFDTVVDLFEIETNITDKKQSFIKIKSK